MDNAIHNRSRNRKQERPWLKRGAPALEPPAASGSAPDHPRRTAELQALCHTRGLIEAPDGAARRVRVLRDLDKMLAAWGESLLPGSPPYAENLAAPNPDRDEAPELLSFGSYRLGVHTPDADVDCLVLAPPHVTRDDLFGSWVDVLEGEPRVTELHPVSSAYTPVIKFEMDAVKIDLIFARTNNSKWLTEQRALVPPGGELRVDDSVLVGLDETSTRSVNGVRVAQFLLDTLGERPAAVDRFRLTLRIVKEWARVHGLYSNVLGFLGGVNWAILVAWVSQRNPEAPVSQLLQLFFRTFAHWGWPSPVTLAPGRQDPPEGVRPLPVWDPVANYRDKKDLMPILTPCYPSMNSAYNVGAPQLRRLRDELRRASALSAAVLAGTGEWGTLFTGNDFFRRHANYLQIDVIATNAAEFRSWFGLCESRMRVLIAGLESPFSQAYPFAKFFPHRRGAAYVSSFFVALRFSPPAKRVDLGPLVADYLRIVNEWEGRRAGMDLEIRLVLKRNLPAFVLDDERGRAAVPVAREPPRGARAAAGDTAPRPNGEPGNGVAPLLDANGSSHKRAKTS